MKVGLGDLPGWITACIALGGVLYGAYNLRKLTLDRQRTQADKIYFGFEFDDLDGRTGIHVLNLSDMPITLVELYFRDYPEWTWSKRFMKPLLMMGDDWGLDLHYPQDLTMVLGYVSFTDASNRTWYRLSNGKLYSHNSHPGTLTRLRFFPGKLTTRVRTFQMKPEQKDEWLKHHGFIGSLFRWGFDKQYS